MASSGGHWKDLAELQKLTQTFLIPGVVNDNIKRGGLIDRFPLAQGTGKDIAWNRSSTVRTAKKAGLGDTLVWEEQVAYEQITTELKMIYDQSALNKFVRGVYGSINDYEAQQLLELQEGCLQLLEDELIYGDLTYGTNEFDGLHAWAETQSGDLDIDEGDGALSLANMRALGDAMKRGVDLLLAPFELGRRFDALVPGGIVEANRAAYGNVQITVDQLGRRITFWDGIPIMRSDYMLAETNATGQGSDARAKWTSGTKYYTIFALKFGNVFQRNPGLTLAFGGERNELGELFRLDPFAHLESKDASGIRLVGYFAVLAGSDFSVGRVTDITDAAITE